MKKDEVINLDFVNNIHFIGVGGVSMSALCLWCKMLGKKVSGSDIQKNNATKVLVKNGVKVFYKHSADNINNSVDLVVYNGAINDDNVEILKAKELKIRIVSRGEFLGAISSSFDKVIAISGTHGKSTTTSMISNIFLNCGVNFCSHIGANALFLKDYYALNNQENMLNNFKFGKGNFVTEACEYKSNFLHTKNYIGVITNIEKEHLDYFKTQANEYFEFEKFAKNSKYLVLNYNLKDKINIKNNYVLYVALRDNKADVYAKNIKKIKQGGYIFDCYIKNTFYGKVVLGLIGEFNIYNCLCALSVCYFFGLNKAKVLESIQNFRGVERRMEYIGNFCNSRVYLDYAHHPTEIFSTLKAIQENIKSDEVLIVFQPHTYSRTKLLFNDFVKVFASSLYDVIFLPTYSAREKVTCGVECKVLYEEIKTKKQNVLYLTKANFKKHIKAKNSVY